MLQCLYSTSVQRRYIVLYQVASFQRFSSHSTIAHYVYSNRPYVLYYNKGFWVFLIQKVSRVVDVFCRVADMCGGECIICCAIVRDRDDIGWFVVYCIQQS